MRRMPYARLAGTSHALERDIVGIAGSRANPAEEPANRMAAYRLSGSVGPPIACQPAMPPASVRTFRPRRRIAAVALPLT